MTKRTRDIRDVKRELIHLERKYTLLQIKTLDYRDIKKKLEKELKKCVDDINKGIAKDLKDWRPSQRESFKSSLNDVNELAKNPQNNINSDDEYRTGLKSGNNVRL